MDSQPSPDSMIATSAGEKKPPTLNADIWGLIFEQVVNVHDEVLAAIPYNSTYVQMEQWELEPRPPAYPAINPEYAQRMTEEQQFKDWLQPLRLLSRDMCEVVTPLFYRELDLRSYTLLRILTLKSAPEYELLKGNICAYARDIILTTDRVYLETSAEIVASCKALRSAKWQTTLSTPRICSLYLRAFLQNHSSCVLNVNHRNEPLEFGYVMRERTPLEKTETTQLARSSTNDRKELSAGLSEAPEKDPGGMGSSSANTSMVKEYLRSQKGPVALDFLRLSAPLFDLDLRIESFGAKVPAMRKLVLEKYTWDYTNAEFQQTWDFSRLRSLVLNDGALEFLEFAPVDDLTHLESLTLRRWNFWDYHHPHRPSFSTYFENVLAKVPRLKKLKIVGNCWSDYIPVGAIFGLKKLEKLVLREYFCPKDSLMVRTVHLSQLQTNCQIITSLGLDIFMSNSEAENFLHILSEFESLRNLTLWSTISLDTGAFEGSEDPDYDAARNIMVNRHSRKEGVVFDLLQINLLVLGNDETEVEERLFASRINEMGVYEQWGSNKHPIPDLGEGDGANGEDEADT